MKKKILFIIIALFSKNLFCMEDEQEITVENLYKNIQILNNNINLSSDMSSLFNESTTESTIINALKNTILDNNTILNQNTIKNKVINKIQKLKKTDKYKAMLELTKKQKDGRDPTLQELIKYNDNNNNNKDKDKYLESFKFFNKNNDEYINQYFSIIINNNCPKLIFQKFFSLIFTFTDTIFEAFINKMCTLKNEEEKDLLNNNYAIKFLSLIFSLKNDNFNVIWESKFPAFIKKINQLDTLIFKKFIKAIIQNKKAFEEFIKKIILIENESIAKEFLVEAEEFLIKENKLEELESETLELIRQTQKNKSGEKNNNIEEQTTDNKTTQALLQGGLALGAIAFISYLSSKWKKH